jgi:hypothetical protein
VQQFPNWDPAKIPSELADSPRRKSSTTTTSEEAATIIINRNPHSKYNAIRFQFLFYGTFNSYPLQPPK